MSTGLADGLGVEYEGKREIGGRIPRLGAEWPRKWVPLMGRGEMGREAAGNKQFPLNVWILRGLLGTGRGAE